MNKNLEHKIKKIQKLFTDPNTNNLTEDQIARRVHASKSTVVRALKYARFTKNKKIHKNNSSIINLTHADNPNIKAMPPIKIPTATTLKSKLKLRYEENRDKKTLLNINLKPRYNPSNINKLNSNQIDNLISSAQFILNHPIEIYKRKLFLLRNYHTN